MRSWPRFAIARKRRSTGRWTSTGRSRPTRTTGRCWRTSELDGVVVAVNHNVHTQVTRDCLNAGLQVHARKADDAQSQRRASAGPAGGGKGPTLIVGYPWHYTAATRKAREILATGALGRVQYMSCLFAAPVVEFFRANDAAYRPSSSTP